MNHPANDPVAVTQALFGHFGNGDVPGILALLHEQVHISFYGPAVIPYAGEYQGKQAAEGFFTTVLSSVDIHQFEPEQFLGSGNQVTVTGALHLTARSTGRDFRSSFAHVITVQDGRWIRFRDYMDTAVAVAAFMP